MTFKLLLIYIITLPLMKTPDLPFLAHRIILSDAVFLFLFALWLKDLIKQRRLPQDPGLNRPFFVFMLFCLLSFFHSSDFFTSSVEVLGLLYLFVMLILVVDVADTRRRLDIVIKFWIVTLAVVLALGFIGWFICLFTNRENPFCWVFPGNMPYLKSKTIYRMLSVFRNPLSLASFLIASLGFVISDILLTENRRYKNFLKVMIFFISLAMASIVGREILAFIISGFLIYNYLHKRRDLKFKVTRILWILLIIALFLFISIFCSSFYIRSFNIESISKGTHRELSVNIDYLYHEKLAKKIAAVEMVRRYPFLGVGLAMYRSYIQRLNEENWFKDITPIYEYSKEGLYFDYLFLGDPHNDILQYFAETGIFGGTTFLLFIGTFLYLGFTNLKKSEERYFKVRLFCFLASFIGLLVESMDLDVFKARHLWILMALTLALIRIEKR